MLNRRSLQRVVLVVSAFAAASASAQQVHLLPKYVIRGEEITDSVAIKQERKGFEASYQQFRVAATDAIAGKEADSCSMPVRQQHLSKPKAGCRKN